MAMTAMTMRLMQIQLFSKIITFPTDAKLHKKIIKKTLKIVQDEQLPIRQSLHPNVKKTGRLPTLSQPSQ